MVKSSASPVPADASPDEAVVLSQDRVAYEYAPDARDAIILIHGNSSCREIFAAQRPALAAARFGALAIDLPGHGGSDDASDPATTYSFPGYAAAVCRVMDALAIKRAHVVGWSLGGHVALELAAGDPRVASVLVTGAPPVRPSAAALADAFEDTPDMSLAGKDRFSERDAAAYVTAMLGCEGSVPLRMIEAARRTDGRARRFMIANGIAGVGRDQRAFVENATIPVAILQGRRDPFLRMDYLEALPGRALWRGGTQWFEDLGHAPHWQAPERFNEALLAFLSDAAGS